MTEGERLTELEIRYTHQQELLEQLSDVIAQQGLEIASLRAALGALQRQADAAGLTPPNEPPPHY
jgi:SlyX protein